MLQEVQVMMPVWPGTTHTHLGVFICPMNVFFNSNENKVPNPLSSPDIPEQKRADCCPPSGSEGHLQADQLGRVTAAEMVVRAFCSQNMFITYRHQWLRISL